jgi:C4-dicarboxylate-specific signal transduction histidine kinase
MQHIHPCDREHVNRTLDGARATRDTLRFDHRIFARDGGVRYLSVIGHPILDSKCTLYAGTVTDVSCRRTDEHVQSRAQAELSRGARLATVGQMAAVIAHEVNQPLMAISANAGAALIGIERVSLDPGRFTQLLREIVEQSQRAGAIIQTLQAMTYRRPRPEPVDMHMVIHQVLLAMRGEFDRHHIAVELDLPEQAMMIAADTAQLQQVVANLIGNAVDAMHEIEGCVRLLQITSRRVEGNKVEVCVADNGAGADAATYAQMFEPFVGTKPGGMGMGLAICRAIIEAHGGKILARGRQPHGCAVIFTIAGQAGIVSRDEAG